MSMGREGEGGMMDQLRRVQERLEQAREELAEEMVEATTGGGAVRIKMSATQRCHEVKIDPDLFERGDAEMLQDLILLAVNQALHESQVVAARKLGPLGSALGPGAAPD